MLIIRSIIELGLIGLLLYGYANETKVTKFERLLFSKRGRRILKKNLGVMFK